MVTVSRAVRAGLLAALVWSLGSLLAAVNWHGNWMSFVRSGNGEGPVALHAQERWQHWVDMTLAGVLVAVLCLALALWPLLRAAGERARGGTEGDRGAITPGGFGGGSEELRRYAEGRDAP
ncbi:hypothetical protein [Quadrisphaera sp. KR29]|uniref:hypothetical protein n=1 Tax=Quadrisphaera sp. KR29 TaxID=3461391 RepID=UPI004044B5FE